MKWLDLAEAEIGIKEVPGAGDNPRVLEYHSATSYGAPHDSVPWCSSFINWCLRGAGIAGTGSAAARSWLDWGQPLNLPREGCIAILRRGNDPACGHVGLYVGQSESHIRLLGGNQSDSAASAPTRKRRCSATAGPPGPCRRRPPFRSLRAWACSSIQCSPPIPRSGASPRKRPCSSAAAASYRAVPPCRAR